MQDESTEVGPAPAARAGQPRAPRWWVRALWAVLAALVLAQSFPPGDLLGGWAALPAMALLVAACRGLRPGGATLVLGAAGAAFFLVLLDWVRVIGADGWIVLSLVCALFWAATGAVLPLLLARRSWVLTVPLAWAVQEALRERLPFGGFPWGRLAFSQADTALVGWAALGGPPLVTFVVVLAATALLAAVDLARARRPTAVAVAVVVLVALPVIGLVVRDAGLGGPDGPVHQVAVVQGNVPRAGLDFNAQRRAVLDNHVEETLALAARVDAGELPPPVAVFWPENSSDIDPTRWPDAAAQIDRAAQAVGVPILVGAMLVNPEDPPGADGPGTVLNVSLVWDPRTGPGEYYAKRHPVPFGEYLPFRPLLSRYITRFQRIPSDFASGDRSSVLQVGPVRAGVVICFETAYGDLVGDAVRGGGRVLVVQTNNATYGLTGQPDQQLAISRVQSVAAGRTTLVAATSGISAVVGPDGSLAWRAEEFVPASTVVAVPDRTGLTPAMRLGQLPEVAAAVALGLVLLRPARSGWRRRPSGGELREGTGDGPASADARGRIVE